MLDENEVKVLLDDLKKTESEVIELKKKLTQINKRKDDLFSKKDGVSGDIRARINELSESKVKRNQLTNDVKSKKKLRDELNAKINSEVALIKKMKDEYEAVKQKLGLKEDPKDLGRQIEQLEYKMQTEPMSFDKEQKMGKMIKELKKTYKAGKDLIDKATAVRNKSKEIDQLKKEANAVHREIQEGAAQSQSHHEALIEKYKSIDEIRKNEEGIRGDVDSFRKEFSEANDELKLKLDALKAIKTKLDENKIAFEENVKEKNKNDLDARRKEVEVKMKSGKKLTTEDLLLLQTGFKN